MLCLIHFATVYSHVQLTFDSQEETIYRDFPIVISHMNDAYSSLRFLALTAYDQTPREHTYELDRIEQMKLRFCFSVGAFSF